MSPLIGNNVGFLHTTNINFAVNFTNDRPNIPAWLSPWTRGRSTRILGTVGPRMWENGLCRWRSLCPGAPVVKEVDLVTQSCFAMEIWVLRKFTLGMNLNEQKKQQLLTSHGGSSLAVRLEDKMSPLRILTSTLPLKKSSPPPAPSVVY